MFIVHFFRLCCCRGNSFSQNLLVYVIPRFARSWEHRRSVHVVTMSNKHILFILFQGSQDSENIDVRYMLSLCLTNTSCLRYLKVRQILRTSTFGTCCHYVWQTHLVHIIPRFARSWERRHSVHVVTMSNKHILFILFQGSPDPENVDVRYMLSFSEQFLPWLPQKAKKIISCGSTVGEVGIRTRQATQYRAITTLRRPQIKQNTA